MSINKALNISLTGLNANQKALNVVSHNIANMNTEGYVKQRVNFAEVRTKYSGSNVYSQIGSLSGVKIASISTSANQYLNNYYRTQNSPYQGLQTEADIAAGLSEIMDELSGTGLGYALEDFFSAANSLNQNPIDYSLRLNFAEKAKGVANKFNSMYNSVTSYKESVVGDGVSLTSAQNSKAGTYVDQINSKLEVLASINKQITMNQSDSSLTSQRDQVLAELSNLTNITTTITSTGTANVYIGDTAVVKGNSVMGTISINADASISFTDLDNNVKDITADIKEGTLGGTLKSISLIDNSLAGLDKLAAAFAEKMNEIQTNADANGTPCYYDRVNDKLVESPANNLLFVASDGGTTITAGNIKISDDIYKNPDLISAARVDTTQTGWETAVGNGDNALLFYDSRNDKLPSLGGLTMEDYIISLSSKAALDSQTKQEAADTQGAVADNIQNRILSETGVNLDEELTDMIRYQQAYNASARVFSCCVEVFDTLVALGK